MGRAQDPAVADDGAAAEDFIVCGVGAGKVEEEPLVIFGCRVLFSGAPASLHRSQIQGPTIAWILDNISRSILLLQVLLRTRLCIRTGGGQSIDLCNGFGDATMKVLGFQVGEAVPVGALLDLNVEGGEEAADTTAFPAHTKS